MFEIQYRFVNLSIVNRDGILATFNSLKKAEEFKKVYETMNNHAKVELTIKEKV